jgi:two-component system LytT family sensor kinase
MFWRLIMWVRPVGQQVYRPMLNEHQPLIMNAVGHMAGAIVFAIFLVLAMRVGSGRRTRQSLLPVASAALALLWNAGSLAMLILPSGTARWIVEAATVCGLSLLPAVLLHLSTDDKYPSIAAAGYVLSLSATAMHLAEGLLPGLALHKWALWTITFGFGSLTVIYAGVVLRQNRSARARTSQILASMCLLLFAVTFSHFGAGHPPQAWKELVVHHVGIPVALLILLQDYRFVFLDAFVRFLANVILAATLSYTGIRLAAGLAPEKWTAQPLTDMIGVAALCGLLILFAYLRGIVQRMLTKAVFRAGSNELAAQELRSRGAETRDEDAFLQWASERLAAAARAEEFEIAGPGTRETYWIKDLDYPTLADAEPSLTHNVEWKWAEAIVPIRLSQRDIRYLLLGRRRGGRRYLSEDLKSLNYLATVVAEEVERFRAAELQRLVSEAELRALHSQINPHFLFNALNTIYGIIPREATAARRTVLNLADIFRYFLQSDRVLIPLSEELKIVRSYLEIERLRLGPRLQTVIQVEKDAEQALIPILSVQPLVENAIKHGLAVRPDQGWLRLTATIGNEVLTIVVEDSGPGSSKHTAADEPSGAGIGMANVTRRLRLCFGPSADLKMERCPSGTRVQFSVPVSESALLLCSNRIQTPSGL